MDVLSLRSARALSLALIAAIALIAGGCGGSRPQARGPLLRVDERDFSISAPRQVDAGDVTLRVDNHGPDGHELLVVRLGNGVLPMRPDGRTVDEEALAQRGLRALEPGASGAVRDLQVHLTPGRYVLFCNMSGHYLGGMHRVLVVR
jgi:uncharacterized cupredoxin-like copper-binding protein